MRILITNDDGIHAPGLKTLEAIARALSDDVWVVAPETDQSGSAHSLTLADPLRVREVAKQHFAVKGTPTDCVIIAIKNLMPSPPDLVLSGVNRGQNLAEDVTYSGTIAGAMEGTLLGIRSIALSQAYSAATRGQPRYATAEALGPELVAQLAKIDVPAGTLFNVNFPDREPDGVTGVAVTTQGRRDQDLLSIDAREDARGFPYYWIVFGRSPFETVEGSDLRAVAEGKISVTPLRLDLTAHELRAKLAASIER